MTKMLGRAKPPIQLIVVNMSIDIIDCREEINFRKPEALAKSGVKLVPDIVAGGSSSGGTLVDVLLGNLLHESMPQLGNAKSTRKPDVGTPGARLPAYR